MENKNPETVESESPMAMALKAELLSLLAAPLTLKQMHKIRRFADAGAKTLMALTGTEHLGRRRFMGEIDEEEPGVPSNPVYGTFGQSNGESYGVTMIREIISAAAAFSGQKALQTDPVQLVQALAVAREKGLTDVEDSLRKQLHPGPAQTLSRPELLPGLKAEPCPTCDSPAQHLHPAVQEGGEVQPCGDAFHSQVTPQNTAAKIAEAQAVSS